MLPIPGNKLCPVPPKIKGAFESFVVVVVLAAIAASTFLSPAFLPSLKVFFFYYYHFSVTNTNPIT